MELAKGPGVSYVEPGMSLIGTRFAAKSNQVVTRVTICRQFTSRSAAAKKNRPVTLVTISRQFTSRSAAAKKNRLVTLVTISRQ